MHGYEKGFHSFALREPRLFARPLRFTATKTTAPITAPIATINSGDRQHLVGRAGGRLGRSRGQISAFAEGVAGVDAAAAGDVAAGATGAGGVASAEGFAVAALSAR